MNKIKVLQIIGNACRGGVESYVLNYYKTMNKEFEFTFVCYNDSPYINYDEIDRLGGKIQLVPNIKHLFKFKKELKRVLLEENYDIVHSHLNALSVFPLGVAKKCGYEVRVATSHTTTNKNEGFRYIIKKFLAHFSKRNANRIQAVSKNAGEYLYGSSKGIDYVYANIYLDKFLFNKEKRDILRKDLNIENKFVVGNIGRLCSQKNQKFILEIANKMKNNNDFCFVIIGDGKKESELKKFKNKHKLDNVMFIPNKENIQDYYNVFDLFILPSIFEGFGLVNLEAQANGLYCLQSNCFTNEALVDNFGKSLDLNIGVWVEEISKKPSRRENVSKILNSKFNNKSENILESTYKQYLKSLKD